MHLTFLNVAYHQYKSTIIGVEWTVPIEMWMYAILPFIFFFFAKLRESTQLLLFVSSVIVSAWASSLIFSTKLEAHWSLIKYFYCFIGGITVYLSWRNFPNSIFYKKKSTMLIVSALIGLGVFVHSIKPEVFVTVLISLLILHAPSSKALLKVLESKFLMHLGKISFPFYLLHYPVLNFLSEYQLPLLLIFIFGYIITATVSHVCHLYIEQPILNLVKIEKVIGLN